MLSRLSAFDVGQPLPSGATSLAVGRQTQSWSQKWPRLSRQEPLLYCGARLGVAPACRCSSTPQVGAGVRGAPELLFAYSCPQTVRLR